MGSQSINYGLDHVADLIQACKDDKGNPNKKAELIDRLKFVRDELQAINRELNYLE